MKPLSVLSLLLLQICGCSGKWDTPYDGTDTDYSDGGDASANDAGKTKDAATGDADVATSDGGVEVHESDAGGQEISTFTEQVNTSCATTYSHLTGTRVAGSTCTSYALCAPSCCTCSTSTHQFSAAACVDGICAADPCPYAENHGLCF